MLCPDIRSLKYDLDAAERLEEACGLALAIGVVIADAIQQRNLGPFPCAQCDRNTLFGAAGQVETMCEFGRRAGRDHNAIGFAITSFTRRSW